MGARDRKGQRVRFAGLMFVLIGTTLLGYLGLSTQFFLGSLQLRLGGLIMCGCACVLGAVSLWLRRRSWGAPFLGRTALIGGATLATLVSADTVYNLILNCYATPLPFAFEETDTVGGLELNLRVPRYAAGGGGRYKPNTRIGGEIFGELVPPQLISDEEFVAKVVERRWVEYRIDAFGFRNADDVWASAEYLAIGDSFTFGAAIDWESTWVRLLMAEGRRIYNLGELGVNPAGEWQRFQELQQKSPNENLRIIFWMIFGGNDLDGGVGSEFSSDSSRVVDGTILVGPLRMLEAIRDDSILGRVRRGALVPLRYPESFSYRGALLPAPLYHSTTLGAKLFYPPYIAQAKRTRDEIERDPELKDLQQILQRCRDTADDSGWHVLVIYAPSAEELAGDYFRDYPSVTKRGFSSWLAEHVPGYGFGYLDLTAALEAAFEHHLPYFRDDTHWNGVGHAIAAQAIARKLRELGWEPSPR